MKGTMSMICKVEIGPDERYASVEKLLRKLANRFYCCNQCSFEDKLSTANLGYVRACQEFDPEKGAFTTIVSWKVKGALIQHKRSCFRQSNRFHLNPEMQNVQYTPTNSILNYFHELSDDAKQVANIIMDAPKEIKPLFVWTSRGKQRWSKKLRYILKTHLTDSGWDMVRISRAFCEVRDAL